MDVATLQVSVKSDGIKKANSELDSFTKKSKKAETATGRVEKEVKKTTSGFDKYSKGVGDAERATGRFEDKLRLLGPALALTGAVLATKKIVSITREFNILNAQLITATGSTEAANTAFKEMQMLAQQTPFDLAQVTTAFVKLKNLGLTPSSEAITDYGNMASAMGKSLNQMVEAVADATTNEFERLKEFGIKAKQSGDDVIFTFKGVSTTVAKESEAIEEYLRKLSQDNFGDSMANQMNTLEGAMSNFGDTWDALFLSTSEAGLGKLIEGMVRRATTALTELDNEIKATTGWYEAFQAGDISVFEWIFTGADEAAVRLDELAKERQVEIDTENAEANIKELLADIDRMNAELAKSTAITTDVETPTAEFASGGYTGSGGKYQPAGVVHKGEVVFSQDDVARHGGVAAVEGMRLRGYAAGGAVGMDAFMSRLSQGSSISSAANNTLDNISNKWDAITTLDEWMATQTKYQLSDGFSIGGAGSNTVSMYINRQLRNREKEERQEAYSRVKGYANGGVVDDKFGMFEGSRNC